MASNPRIDDLRKRLEREPGSRLFAQLAEELRKAGELEEAISLSLDGLQKHANYPSARMTLGRCLLDKGDVIGARREFESVLKGAPDNILASRFLADCFEGLGDLQAAAEQHRAALRLSPGDPQTLQRLADLERKIATGPPPAAGPSVVEERSPAAEGEGELAPIPLASVEDESFELERSYEAPTGPSGTIEHEPPRRAGKLPAPASEPGGILEFEMPEAAGAPPVAPVDGPLEEAPAAIYEPAAPPALVPPQTPAAVSVRPEAAPVPSVPPFRAFEGEPPPPWVAPFPVASDPTPTSAAPEIASSTLAELYFKQGFTDKAIEVYRQVVVREPGNDRALARLTEIQRLEHPMPDAGPVADVASSSPPADPREARRQGLQRAITGLEKMLASVRKE